MAVRRVVVFSALTLLGAAGCEVLVDFDRTKIDAGAADGSISEAGFDAPVSVDAEADAALDAADGDVADAADASVDATDASADAPVD